MKQKKKLNRPGSIICFFCVTYDALVHLPPSLTRRVPFVWFSYCSSAFFAPINSNSFVAQSRASARSTVSPVRMAEATAELQQKVCVVCEQVRRAGARSSARCVPLFARTFCANRLLRRREHCLVVHIISIFVPPRLHGSCRHCCCCCVKNFDYRM